ncbi:RepA [Bromus catharticus striate mosaic virus]|uniref:Replication-associated protein n=1 Tax=Bromus catharticus striate mosaic virus TaxID=936005 RepID=E7D4Y3_9GEMI|nr:RepA [Bromus catharticus striate mosaic virus]ADT91304.1 RepA [Bromus catharticus striate mosaic virus]
MASFVSETSDARGQTGAPRSPSGEVGAPGAVAACFEVRSRNIFLTYSKCHLDPVFMQEHLSSLLRRFEPTYVYVAREEHQDGSYHLHCLVQCKKYVRTKSAKFFDVEEFHPNVQNARMPHKVLAYIKKNPLCFVETGVFQASTKQKKKKVDAPSTKDAKMAEIIKSSTCKEDYLSMVRNTFPFDWATRLQQFQYSAESLFPSVPTPYMDPFGMPAQDEHPVIGAWLQAELFSVSPYAYSIHNGVTEDQARLDLQWMSDISRTDVLMNEEDHSTFADQQELERLLGLEVWELTTTGNTASTSST